MIMFTGWRRGEIEALEVSEIIRHINKFRKIEAERYQGLLKAFAIYNIESTRLAFAGSKSDCEKYIRRMSEEKQNQDNDIEDQFKGIDFGK